jgi:hypothetical protein
MSTSPLRWHYTIGDRFLQIAQDGIIQPATAYVVWPERPVVWFSTHPRWEPTACKMAQAPGGRLRRLTRAETARYGGGLVRIGVAPESAPHDWQAYRRLSGVDPGVARGLAKAAKKQRADPRQWYVSFEPVPAAVWLAVEVWGNGQWTPADPAWPPLGAATQWLRVTDR